jgi:hypothetical protein
MASAAYPTTILMQACGATTGFTTGFKLTGTGGLVQLVINGFNYQAVSAPLPTKMFQVSGATTSVTMVGCLFKSSSGVGTFLEIYNGGLARVVSTLIAGFNKGVYAPNTGTAPAFKIEVLAAELCTTDIQIDHVGATGYIKGSYDRSKVTIASAATVSTSYIDPANSGLISTGPLYLGTNSTELVDVLDLIESPTMGVLYGGDLTTAAGFVVDVAAGFGYLMSGTYPSQRLDRISWNATSITLSANVDVYLYFNSSGTLVSNAAYPDTKNVIQLGRAVTNGSTVELIGVNTMKSLHQGNDLDSWIRDVFNVTFVASGAVVTENATPRKLDITAGSIYVGLTKITPASGTAFTWTKVIQNGSGGFTLTASQDTVPNNKYDDGTGVEGTVAAGKFARHWLYQSGQGANLKRYLALSQATYNSLVLAQAGTAPTVPSYFKDGLIRVSSIITQEGVGAASDIRDERPRPASAAAGSTAVTSHSALSNLSNDDHLQYTKADGTRAFTGNQSMGGNNLTSVGTINSVTVETHKTRHDFNGADALLTGTPVSIGSANATGSSNTSFPRLDHVHDHGSQTVGTMHAAVIAGSTSGFMTGTDKTKLDGIATGATANSSDATLLARANHTGTQLSATVSDFSTAADARITLQKAAANGLATLDGSTLIPAAQHGSYTSGTNHAAATTSVAGFMSAADKTKSDSNGTRVSLRTTATQSTTLATWTSITELTTGTLATGSYRFEYTGLFQSTAAATGVGFRLGAGTATITPCFGKWIISAAANGVAAGFQYDQLTATTDTTSATTPAANTDAVCTGFGSFTVTVAGTVAIQIRSETAATSVSVRTGSVVRIETI